MNVTGVSYDNQGRILSIRVGEEQNVLIDLSSTQHVLTTESVSMDSHYVKYHELHPYPPKPDGRYDWNLATESWVFALEEARALKWSEIKSEREQAEEGGFTVFGFDIDSDRTSQQRIQGAVQMALLDPNLVLDWTLADNSVTSLDASSIIAIGQALAAHVNAIHVQGRLLRAQIEAATSQTELDQIIWP